MDWKIDGNCVLENRRLSCCLSVYFSYTVSFLLMISCPLYYSIDCDSLDFQVSIADSYLLVLDFYQPCVEAYTICKQPIREHKRGTCAFLTSVHSKLFFQG